MVNRGSIAGVQHVVDTVLTNSEETKFKTTQVDNVELIDLDEGVLLASNENKTDLKQFRQNTEETLRESTWDATQALFNSLWQVIT